MYCSAAVLLISIFAIMISNSIILNNNVKKLLEANHTKPKDVKSYIFNKDIINKVKNVQKDANQKSAANNYNTNNDDIQTRDRRDSIMESMENNKHLSTNNIKTVIDFIPIDSISNHSRLLLDNNNTHYIVEKMIPDDEKRFNINEYSHNKIANTVLKYDDTSLQSTKVAQTAKNASIDSSALTATKDLKIISNNFINAGENNQATVVSELLSVKNKFKNNFKTFNITRLKSNKSLKTLLQNRFNVIINKESKALLLNNSINPTADISMVKQHPTVIEKSAMNKDKEVIKNEIIIDSKHAMNPKNISKLKEQDNLNISINSRGLFIHNKQDNTAKNGVEIIDSDKAMKEAKTSNKISSINYHTNTLVVSTDKTELMQSYKKNDIFTVTKYKISLHNLSTRPNITRNLVKIEKNEEEDEKEIIGIDVKRTKNNNDFTDVHNNKTTPSNHESNIAYKEQLKPLSKLTINNSLLVAKDTKKEMNTDNKLIANKNVLEDYIGLSKNNTNVSIKIKQKSPNICNGVVFHGEYYTKQLLFKGLKRAHSLMMHEFSGVLFFSHSIENGGKEDFQITACHVEKRTCRDIQDIPGGYAVFYDSINDDIYFGGRDGIYKYNYHTKSAKFFAEKGKSIRGLFIRRSFCYIEYHTHSLYIYNRSKFFKIGKAKSIQIDNYFVSIDLNVYFSNNTGIFKVTKPYRDPFVLNDNVDVRQITEDGTGEVYFGASDGIYIEDIRKHSTKKVANIDQIYGITFIKIYPFKSQLIYSNEDAIYRLLPSKYNKWCSSRREKQV